MKKIAIVVLGIILFMAAPLCVYGAAVGSKLWETTKTEVGSGAIEHTPIVLNGLPATQVVTYKRVSDPPVITYTGTKQIPFTVKTAGVIVSAQSDNPKLNARYNSSNITLENNGLVPGETANVIISFYSHNTGTLKKTMPVKITNGTKDFPHLVANSQDLKAIKSLGLNKYYVQTTDIDLYGINDWEPIGETLTPFTGIYSGEYHLVKNMGFTKISGEYPALFGVVGLDGRIENLTIEGKINADVYITGYHGSIAGKLDGGAISNCSFKGEMNLLKNTVTAGGIVGLALNKSVINDCTFEGKILSSAANSIVGGIAGVSYADITGAAVKGDMSVEGVRTIAGGVVGRNFGKIEKSSVEANVSRYGESGKTGGIAGENQLSISGSSYKGKVHSKGIKSLIGGVTAINSGSISEVAVAGSLTFDGDQHMAGGIAGQNSSGSINDCTNSMIMSGAALLGYIGGIAGENYSQLNEMNATLLSPLVTSINRCVFGGEITVKGGGALVGGIAGRNYAVMMTPSPSKVAGKTIIENCLVTAKSISGDKAARITPEIKIDGVGANSSTNFKSELVNNVALSKVLVNGKTVGESSKNGINGGEIDESEIEAFMKIPKE